MSNEGFFRRWARLKSTGGDAATVEAPRSPLPGAPAAAPATPVAAGVDAGTETPPRPLPTLEDAARLTPDADFSAFVARGVDKSVQRLALKKLFADPHFKVMDGLDTYMHDYNKAAPLAPAMLASLKHAPDVLSRLLGDQQEEKAEEGAAAAAQAQDELQELKQELKNEHHYERSLEGAPPSTRQGNA